MLMKCGQFLQSKHRNIFHRGLFRGLAQSGIGIRWDNSFSVLEAYYSTQPSEFSIYRRRCRLNWENRRESAT